MIDAAAYGKALFDLAWEEGVQERLYRELELAEQAFRADPAYVTLLDTPAVSTEEKLCLLKEAFGGFTETGRNFLSILCEKRSIHRFFDCRKEFNKAYDEAQNILRATAITALPMSPKQMDALKSKLAELTGKTVVLENKKDEKLIGGMILRYGGVQLDDSILSRLDKLRRSLSQTIV